MTEELLSDRQLNPERQPTSNERPSESAPLVDSQLEPNLSLVQAKADAKLQQQNLPIAIVQGKTMVQLPLDLFIPPDCLDVYLDSFEGPLDLLLYLIKKQNIDVLNINVFDITQQYMQYVEVMQSIKLELAADYLLMAAMLMEIKSRILLPRNDQQDDEEEGQDPRAELIRRLQEYERFKQAAQNIEQLPRIGRDQFVPPSAKVISDAPLLHPDVEMQEIMRAFKWLLERADMQVEHDVAYETLSTRERMTHILSSLQGKAFVPYISLFDAHEGRLGVVVTFLAIMELSKEQLLDIVQAELFGPIHVKLKGEQVDAR